jgi:hypothetical protein
MLKSIVDLYASLILAPVVLLGFGGAWTQYRSFEPEGARLLAAGEPGEVPRSQAVSLGWVEESAPIEAGTFFGRGQLLEIELPGAVRTFSVTVQASVGHAFRIGVSEDGERYRHFWVAPGLRVEGERALRDKGLMSRRSPLLDEPAPVRFLRIAPGPGRGRPAIAGVRIEERARKVPHWTLVPALWVAWLALVLLRRATGTRSFAEGLQRLWVRADVGLAGVLVGLARFDFALRPVAATLWTGAAIALLWAIRAGARRLTPEAALAATLSIAVALTLVPRLWAQLALPEVAAIHDLSVDHRSTPDGDEINSDGARFRGEAADLAEEDFVVLFLGDSFTYGYRLDYDETYPAAVERALGARDCTAPVRVVNFGWLSSSPLLSFRLLRELGAKYRPDLVVYNLDMTDFHDDLRYAADLRDQGDRIFSPGDVLWASLLARAPALERATRWVAERAPLRSAEAGADIPRDRFFATSRPLAHSRQLIERGVMRNLERIHHYARDALGVPAAVIVLPRAYQHSRDETPRNWERSRYEVLGPYVREPFRYFEELEGDLAYPVFELLSAFEAQTQFPLYFEDDPHWNPDGARLAAETAVRQLLEAGLVPCAGNGGK